MKKKLTTLCALAALFLCMNISADDTYPGLGWGYLGLGEGDYPRPFIDENFQNWTKTHTATEAFVKLGTAWLSTKYFDEDIAVPVYDAITGVDTGEKLMFKLIQCAVAPDFYSQYYYENQLDPTKWTEYSHSNVSKGYVELGRTAYSGAATQNGELIISKMEYIEGVQYSYASTGGNKRGFTLSKSTDDGNTWEIVRQETGNLTTSTSGYNVQESGYGIRFEDIIDTENVMLKFEIFAEQVLRIHDLKIYGKKGAPSGIDSNQIDAFSIKKINENVVLSEESDVEIYAISGQLIKTKQNCTTISISELPSGVYIVKASGNTQKIVK